MLTITNSHMIKRLPKDYPPAEDRPHDTHPLPSDASLVRLSSPACSPLSARIATLRKKNCIGAVDDVLVSEQLVVCGANAHETGRQSPVQTAWS